MGSEIEELPTWTTVDHDGTTTDVKIAARAEPYAVGARWGTATDGDRLGLVALFHGTTPEYVADVPEPRSVGVAATGRFVVADWIEYGESTDSRVFVVDPNGTVVFNEQLEYGAVLVDIDDTGTHLAVSTYESAVRIYDIEEGILVGLHPCAIADRPVVDFTSDDTTQIELREHDGSERLYSITTEGTQFSEDSSGEIRRYINSFDPSGEADWLEAAEEFRTAYFDADTDELRQFIIEELSDHPLRNVTSERALKSIIDDLESWRAQTDRTSHQRALAIRLADAYYRLAKAVKTSTGGAQFWDHIDTAQEYAEAGLPWYEAKSMLAKTHRIQSRTHERRNEPHEARHHLDRIAELEQEYDISLLNAPDEKRLSDL